jgi:hypothetical protein
METIIGSRIKKENKKRHGRQSTIFSDFSMFQDDNGIGKSNNIDKEKTMTNLEKKNKYSRQSTMYQ